jgi:phosphoribosyl 1,2-cyclic phosphodiesterase
MKICALSSGSSGNCFYILNKNDAILIDAGLTCRQIEERINEINESANKVRAVFLTHEHIDHIRGVEVFSKKFNIPIYATKGTGKGFLQDFETIKNNECISVAGMEVEAFSKSHDASDAVSFTIRNGRTISIITDLGKICKNSEKAIKESDFLVIEANHDKFMLDNGPYPPFLKKRISSSVGHLSNFISSLAVLEHGNPSLKHVMLAHLSENNNTPKHALNAFRVLKERTDLKPVVSLSLRKPTEIFSI